MRVWNEFIIKIMPISLKVSKTVLSEWRISEMNELNKTEAKLLPYGTSAFRYLYIYIYKIVHHHNLLNDTACLYLYNCLIKIRSPKEN